MKMLSTYFKEMKIASRGFYFYIEIFIAILLLIIVLVAIKDNPDSKAKEYLYYDMSEVAYSAMLQAQLDTGKIILADDTVLELKANSFDVVNRDTDEVKSYTFDSKKTITVQTLKEIDADTGQILTTLYVLDSEEDMLRLSMSTGNMGATIIMDELGAISYRYVIQGYEAERYSNFLYIVHSVSTSAIQDEIDRQNIREIGSSSRLTNKEAVVPIFVVFMGSLMGFFIVISYLYLDKDEGVIKAFAVTPSSVWKYLLSKTFVILTTVFISSSIIVIPIMGLKPNYLLFYPFLLITTFAFSALGLLVASFFDSISKAFTALYVILMALMLPAFSYYISSFDPLWLRFFPTYAVLQAMKGILMGEPDYLYVLISSLAFLVGGFGLLMLANLKFKKSLTV